MTVWLPAGSAPLACSMHPTCLGPCGSSLASPWDGERTGADAGSSQVRPGHRLQQASAIASRVQQTKLSKGLGPAKVAKTGKAT